MSSVEFLRLRERQAHADWLKAPREHIHIYAAKWKRALEALNAELAARGGG